MLIEYQCLALMSLFFLFAWFPVSLGKIKAYGGKWLASNRVPLEGKVLPPWAARCDRAYSNLKDYFPAFIVAILILGAQGKFSSGTSYAALLYVIARIGHYVSYGFGNVTLRALFFFLGLFSNLYLLMKVFF